MAWFDPTTLTACFQIVLIDLTLAGDNAIVVALVAARVAREDRARVVAWGIAAATGLRIAFAVLASYFLNLIGLTLAGGLLLLWVVWKLFRELRSPHPGDGDGAVAPGGTGAGTLRPAAAMMRIVIADISMSLDNVLAVAGTARQHLGILVAGLALSVALMGMGSTVVTRVMRRFPWVVWLGLGVIAYVAVKMIWDGWIEVERAIPALRLF